MHNYLFPQVPDLKHIDVRWVDDFNDWALRDLLCITKEKGDLRSRYPNLRGLQLSGEMGFLQLFWKQ